jgi:arylsulfatase A-like enzyme
MSRIKKKYLIFLIVLLLLVDIVGGLGWYIVNKSDYFKKTKKPNVILISIDTLRPDHLKAYGYPKDTSPNITKWAMSNAYIMQNAYTLTPITYPSFTTLMTGESPYTTRIYNNGMTGKGTDGKIGIYANPGFNPIPNNLPTIATVLKAQGYATASFDENYALRNNRTNLGKGFDTYRVYGESPVKSGVTNEALDWMQETLDKSNPFFVWVHYLDPHETFTPKEENACLFGEKYCQTIKTKGIATLVGEAKNQTGCHLIPLPEDEVGIQEALYDGEIYQTDSRVGKLLDFIQQNELDKNSIIILYSDHGEGFDHNYYYTHSDVLYESSIKIMMMLSLPGVKGGGKKILTPVTNEQFYPTLTSLLNLPTNVSGTSFSDLLTNKKSEKETESVKTPIFYINETAGKFAVRQGNYKFIYTIPVRSSKCLSQQEEELYDVVNDPLETKNLATQMDSLRDSLKSLLLDHIQQTHIISDEEPLSPQITRPVSKEDEDVLKSIRDLGY